MTMSMIDLRSDTVTVPTPEMREAMANAPVGDDVFGEDPTINQLQEEAAAMLGKEAALFVASGTMGNLTSVLSHCARGDEMILGKDAHIFRYEVASAAMYGGVQPNTLPVQTDGTLDLDQIRRAIRGDNAHFPPTRLICLENTQASAFGAPLPPDYISEVAAIAREHNLKLHIDGARLFNAATALGVPASELVKDADSVSICLSKGLCAPVGSMIVGSREFINRAHRVRKSLGGGMRQAGILAAAGLISLRDMTRRLHEDHATTRQFAEGIAQMPHIKIDVKRVKTNIVYFNLTADAPITAEELSARLQADHNILMRPYDVSEQSVRVLTHYWIKPEHIDRTLSAMRSLLDPVSAGRERISAD